MTTGTAKLRIPAAAQLDGQNPWPGLDSYSEASAEYFRGRADEADELLRRIVDEPVTVLFGKSGLGKTSLLNAGVFPRLREKGLLPVLIRLQFRSGSEPLIHQVQSALFDQLKAEGVEHQPWAETETLWEWLHRAKQELWTKKNHLVRPVFVFDQFEEIFTLGGAVPDEVRLFREDLADLAENRIPASVATRFDQGATPHAQLDAQAMPYKVVVTLREDFLADLESWRLAMPSLRRNRMRLLPMGPAQAFQAVHNPHTKHLVSETLARKIVAFLASGVPGSSKSTTDTASGEPTAGLSVEPALLSLFCRGVNEHRKRDLKDVFDDALIEGAKGTIVSDFYRSCLADQPPRVHCFIEEDLITEHGFRNSYSVDDAVGRGAVTAEELSTLINRHLLRHEHYLGVERVELTHDLLTKAVVEQRDVRRLTERGERERRNRWKRLGTAAVVAGLLLAPVLGWLAVRAYRSEQAARIESAQRRSKELANYAGWTVDSDPELSMALALEGLAGESTPEARGALLEAARYVWPNGTLKESDLGGAPHALALNHEGSRLAVLAGSGATVWDVTARTPKRLWSATSLTNAKALAFSPDQKTIAVGRLSAITMLDASTGETTLEIPLAESSARDRPLTFSPDGRWLAWRDMTPETQRNDRHIVVLLDFATPDAPVQKIETKQGGAFAMTSDTRIVTVGVSPLEIEIMVKEPSGRWRSEGFDFSACNKPQSISPGARYLSATWRGKECTYHEEGGRPQTHGTDRYPLDTIWSVGGSVLVELFTSGELIVRRGESGSHPQRTIKGEPIDVQPDLTRLVAISDSGTRLAFIDGDEQKEVRFFSLGGDRPFLTSFDSGHFAAADSGEWFAVGGIDREGKPVVDIFTVDMTFAADRDARGRRIQLSQKPESLLASSDSLIVRLDTDPPTTMVYDVKNGAPRYPAVPGTAIPIGASGDLLLFESPWRIVSTRDGTPATSAPTLDPAADIAVRLSPNNRAIAFLFRGGRQGTSRAVAYGVNGTVLTKVVEMAALSEDPEVTDSGQFAVEDQSALMSPLGQFELREGGPDDRGLNLFRSDQKEGGPIKRFAATSDHSFSADDKRLAVWDRMNLQIVDSATGETVLTWKLAGISSVIFRRDNTLLEVSLSDGVMLVPLDQDLMIRFARWLTPRTMTMDERCMYDVSQCR